MLFRAIAGLAAVGLFGAALALSVLPPSDGPYPLGAGTRIAVSGDGNIYCTVVRRSLVQVFSRSGQLLDEIPIPAKKGGFTVGAKDGGVEVAVFRTGSVLELASDGSVKELSAAESEARFRELTAEITGSTTDAEGNRYEVQGANLVRLAPDGRSEILVRSPRVARPTSEAVWLLFPMSIALAGAALLGAGRCAQLARRLARIRYGTRLWSRRSSGRQA